MDRKKKTAAIETLSIPQQRIGLKQIREKWSDQSRFYPFYPSDKLSGIDSTLEEFSFLYLQGLNKKRQKYDIHGEVFR